MTPPRRGGLGRGLGALIPTDPVAVDLASQSAPSSGAVDSSRADVDRASSASPPASASPAGTADVDDWGVSATAAIAEASSRVVDVTDWSLDPSSPATEPTGARFAEVPIASIRPNPAQPRQIFEPEALAELVDSLRAVGVLQPVVVRPLAQHEGPVRYELVMGERRWRAATEAGFAHIPAIIRATEDADMLRDALLENLHRAALNPLEEAAAYAQLLEEFDVTHEVLATRIGRSRAQVSNTIRLLNLPAPVQRRVAAGVLSAGHARALLGLTDADAQDAMATRIVAEGLSVRAVEELVALDRDQAPARPRATRQKVPPDAASLALAERVAERLDTRVRMELAGGRPRLVVEAADTADLARIVALIAPGSSDGVQREYPPD